MNLLQHEIYLFQGAKGSRLSNVDVNRIYMNMTVWLEREHYRYDSSQEDELGFKVFTEFPIATQMMVTVLEPPARNH